MKGAGLVRVRVSGFLRSLNLFETFHLSGVSCSEIPPVAALLSQSHPCSRNSHFSSVPNRPIRGQRGGDRSEDDFLRSLNFGGNNGGGDRKATDASQSSSSYASDRSMREDRGLDDLFPDEDADRNVQRGGRGPPLPPSPPLGRPMREEAREGVPPRERANLAGEFAGGRLGSPRQNYPADRAGRPPGGFERGDRPGNLFGDRKMNGPPESSVGGEKRGDQPVSSLLQKLKFGKKAEEEKTREQPPIQASEADMALSASASQDADEIFRKMKETGLIPNAVAMLDGLCKDGLVQEAMKLFGLMREKGTIPEVVIYTAVVDGFCKAAKFDDAKRVFRKMQSNGISPNAFSYKVLIEGLFRGKRLEDSVDFSLEMLDAGHSPSVVTFTGLVDELCNEKGVEEAESVVRRLRERGLAVDDRTIREHLDKKGPSSQLVWEAIFGKKVSQRPF